MVKVIIYAGLSIPFDEAKEILDSSDDIEVIYKRPIQRGDLSQALKENPNIIGASRKKRIAAGAGVKVEDVNRLLKSFDQMKSMIKKFSGPGAGKKMKRMRGMGGMGGFGFPGF